MKKIMVVVFILVLSVSANAQVVSILSVADKADIVTSKDKLFFGYELQEKLRLLHNQKGKEYKDGKITKEDWELWLKEYFNPRSEAITAMMLEARQNALNSDTKEIDFDKDFEVK